MTETKEVLWAVFISGPDAVVPTEGKIQAHALAASVMNMVLSGKTSADGAHVTTWPYSPELHAKELRQRRDPGAAFPLLKLLAPLFDAAGIAA